MVSYCLVCLSHNSGKKKMRCKIFYIKLTNLKLKVILRRCSEKSRVVNEGLGLGYFINPFTCKGFPIDT